MYSTKKIPAFVFIASCCSAHSALLVSFQQETSFDTSSPLLQSFSTTTRTSGGGAFPETTAMFAGISRGMAAQEIGTSDYNGIDVDNFSGAARFTDLARFGSDTSGGLLTWDYDLSTYFSGITVGSGAGESSLSLEIQAYDLHRNDRDSPFFISYTGDGLTLDTTDITTHTVSGIQSGTENFNLVNTSTLYQQIGAITGTDGSLSIDLTSQFETIAAGSGTFRIAYLEPNFRGDIRFTGTAGIVDTVNVPEPTSAIFLLLSTSLLFIRKK